MNKPFLDKNFLLHAELAQELYHVHAAKMPIIDYHCHLSPADIAADRKFKTITEAWLEGDHYKWRAMRANGINEKYITGNASDEEKFQKWAETVPKTLRNPLYHWTHLELQRYFDIETILNADTASAIYKQANEKLQTEALSCRGILKKMNVKVVCTTDDPIDDLAYHRQLATDFPEVKILPTFRPDKAYIFHDVKAYLAYVNSLSEAADLSITSFHTLVEALEKRADYFNEIGCKLSDHGLNYIPDVSPDDAKATEIFEALLMGHRPDEEEAELLQKTILVSLGKIYHKLGWTQQLHLGAIRNNNDRMKRDLGPDTGFDSIGDFSQAAGLADYLNTLNDSDQLAQTILYNLNPADNELMATMAGNYNDGTSIGKMQYGAAWWFLDQKDGMEKQINALSNMGLLSLFVGMLTDSRSLLSFPRHEYFRRILCNLLAEDVKNGEIPDDKPLLAKMVEDISYNNAKNYFNF